MRFLIIFLLFSTFAFSHETKFPYDYFKTEAIYHLDTGQIIYVEKYVHGYILWEKNANGRLNKLGSFRGFYGIAKECHAYKDKEFKNIICEKIGYTCRNSLWPAKLKITWRAKVNFDM